MEEKNHMEKIKHAYIFLKLSTHYLDNYDFFDKLLNNLINVELALVLQYVNETIPLTHKIEGFIS